jgi:hypothetical protein
VDKLWLGVLNRDPHHVFDFIVQLITQAKKRTSSIGGNSSSSASSSGSGSSGLASQSLDNIYRCLNRCILFLLSRPADSISEQMSLLEALHKLTNHRCVINSLAIHLSTIETNFVRFFQEFDFRVGQSRPGIYRLPVPLSPPTDVDFENLVSFIIPFLCGILWTNC